MEGSSPVFVFHRTKLKNQEYETLDHLECDLNLMFENAKRYNVPNSAIYVFLFFSPLHKQNC